MSMFGEILNAVFNSSNNTIKTSGPTGSSADQLQGNVADNAVDSGNPVKVGGKYNATAPTYADGDRGDQQIDERGNTKTTLGTQLDEDNDAVTTYGKEVVYTTATSSGVISAVPIALCGYYVAASTSGVVSLYDHASSASGSAVLLSGKTVSANEYVMLPVPIRMENGIYFQLGSGSATVRVLTRKITSV